MITKLQRLAALFISAFQVAAVELGEVAALAHHTVQHFRELWLAERSRAPA